MRHAYDDLTFERLSVPEQFLLWAARHWIGQLKAARVDLADLRRGFALARVPDGLAALDELLGALACGATRPLDMGCPACQRIGEDEALLLHAVATLQAGDNRPALAVLRNWLPPALVAGALTPATVLAGLLHEAGLGLPVRGAETAVRLAVPGLRERFLRDLPVEGRLLH